MAGQLSKTARIAPNEILVWLVLLVSAVLHVPIYLSASNIIVQIAAFDFVIITLVIWGLWRGWLDLPPKQVVLVVIGIITAVMVHTTLFFFFSSAISNGCSIVP